MDISIIGPETFPTDALRTYESRPSLYHQSSWRHRQKNINSNGGKHFLVVTIKSRWTFKKINATLFHLSGQYFLMSLLWLIVATTSDATKLNYLKDTTTHLRIDLVRHGEHLWRSIGTSRGKVWDKSFISERGMSVICGQRVSRYVGPWHAKSVSALGCRPA